jgi:hypothetical protein
MQPSPSADTFSPLVPSVLSSKAFFTLAIEPRFTDEGNDGPHRSVSGHQGGYEMREIVNALLYQSRTGCQWDYRARPGGADTITALYTAVP